MRTGLLQRLALAMLPLLLAAGCTGDSGEKEGASTSVLGFYTYADPTRGGFSLALLADNRFMLVTEPGSGVPQGASGWYVLNGDEIHLSSKQIDAYGTVEDDIIRLVFGEPGVAEQAVSPDTVEGLPFVREDAPASQQGGSLSGSQQTQGQSDSSSGGSSESGSGKGSSK